jgi:hypothetical protein
VKYPSCRFCRMQGLAAGGRRPRLACAVRVRPMGLSWSPARKRYQYQRFGSRRNLHVDAMPNPGRPFRSPDDLAQPNRRSCQWTATSCAGMRRHAPGRAPGGSGTTPSGSGSPAPPRPNSVPLPAAVRRRPPSVRSILQWPVNLSQRPVEVLGDLCRRWARTGRQADECRPGQRCSAGGRSPQRPVANGALPACIQATAACIEPGAT